MLKYSTFALPDYQKDTDHVLLCRTLAYSDITVELLNYDEDLMRRSIDPFNSGPDNMST